MLPRDSETPLDLTNHASSPFWKKRFCPHAGFASEGITREMHHLLHKRLLLATSILFVGFSLFLIKNLIAPWPAVLGTAQVLISEFAMVTIVGACAGILYLRPCLSVKNVRTIELVVFGACAAFFVWMQYSRISDPDPVAIEQLPSQMTIVVIPWLLLIQMYGLFIPNTPQRAAMMITAFIVLPLTMILMARNYCSIFAGEFEWEAFASMVLILCICGTAAVYGSHRFEKLTKQAYTAQSVGMYSLKEKLGSGGMGEVYLAEHQLLKRPCAIKLIRPEKAEDLQAIARFESEVQATARLSHPNTIEIYDYGHTQEGTFYYAMEYLPGLSLQDLVDRYGPLCSGRVIFLLRQICSALREAHDANLVHRDIKPGNIFAAERGGLYDFVKLLDFGLVKSFQSEDSDGKLTLDGTLVGSPLYAAPEMIRDNMPDVRSDIYSLGATAYFLLTAQPLFFGKTVMQIIFAHAQQRPIAPSEIVPGVLPELEHLVLKCLEKEPEDRYSNMAELESALAQMPCEWDQEKARDWWCEHQTGLSFPLPSLDTRRLEATVVTSLEV